MAYFVADEKLQGYYVSGGVTINIVKYHFECDDAASLPAQTAFISSKNIKISMASTAHTLSDNKIYEMNSAGTWKDMTNSPSTYDAADIVYDNASSGMTATNVQAAIDELYETKVTLQKVFGRGVGIVNGDDLDNYQALGKFYASSGAIAASLAHCPVSTGFTLTVSESFQVSGGIVQTIETLISGGSTIDIFKRMRIFRNNTWTWGDWNKYGGAVQ